MRWKRWLSRSLLSLGLVMFVVGFVRFYTADWTGFEAKVLWDWLELLLIPAVLTGGGIWFTRSENRQAREIEKSRVEENRRIEHDRTQDTIVKDYLDQMTELLLTRGLRTSLAGDEVRSVARARTLTALRDIDGMRKATIIQFLYEARLIGYFDEENKKLVEPIMKLAGANLKGINLRGAELDGINLESTNLEQANLVDASLRFACLGWANLARAKLRDAALSSAFLISTDLTNTDLVGTFLHKALLFGANLADANLEWAHLRSSALNNANLEGATLYGAHLAEATLSNCEAVTISQLLEAESLHGATLPDYINPADLGDLWSPPETANTPEPEP